MPHHEMWGFGSGEYSRSGLLGCDAVWCCGRVPTFFSPWRWRQPGYPKCWYPIATLHGVTTQKNSTWMPDWFLETDHFRLLQSTHRCTIRDHIPFPFDAV